MGRPVSTRTCDIPECGRPHKSRGWCNMHYRAWQRHGDPLGGRRSYSSAEESFAGHTERRGECLIWTGHLKDGYGQMRANGRLTYAHRYAREREHGPIPSGMKVDHRYHCDPACCEVGHLRLATDEQNAQNLRGPRAANASGVRGVQRRGNSYGVHVAANGTTHWLGSWPSLEEAEFAAVIGRARLHDYHSPADLEYLAARGLSVDSIKAGDYGPSYRLTPSDFSPHPEWNG